MIINVANQTNESDTNQQHLDYQQRINLGSYYTQKQFTDIVWQMISPHLSEKSIVLDSSCGYGNFLKNDTPYQQIGNDIDARAVERAGEKNGERVGATTTNTNHISFYTKNALINVNRKQYDITKNAHLCIIGNPPYNDKTSMNRNEIKCNNTHIDHDIVTRDLGMSFLLSYQKLSADIVCVLHPLSFLIKHSNFNAIKKFTNEYELIDGKVISSGVFKEASKSMQFPIVIALYKKSKLGTSYQEIIDFNFQVLGENVSGNKSFALSQFDTISQYVNKYPNKQQTPKNNDILFWTLRDINALKRNQTFIKKHSASAIIINKKQLDYYIYIDVFKHSSKHIPYYFGNCDVLIDNNLFKKYKRYFILDCLSRHPDLHQYYTSLDFSKSDFTHLDMIKKNHQTIQAYFQKLLGTHYII